MPTQHTAMMHSTPSSNNDTTTTTNNSDDLLALSPQNKPTTTTTQPTALIAATSRPFTHGRTTTTSSRPIYGRRSISFDPRLNSRVRNEQRVPNDVRIRSRSLENVTVRERRRRGKEEEEEMSTWSTKYTDNGDRENAIGALEICKESLSPDVADFQVNHDNDVEHDDQGFSKMVPKSSKRRLSYPEAEDRDEENENQFDHDASLQRKKLSSSKHDRSKVKRRKVKRTDEASRPNNDAKQETLSFTDSSEQQQPWNPPHHHRRFSTGTKTTTTIAIRAKSNNGNNIIPGKSQMKELRDLAKANNGTATQYRATYHTGAKPIQDKNDTAGRNMIQVGQLIIKETSVTCKGNKGGNSYSFDAWKLPGSKQRESSIYDSTRPKLVGANGKSAVLTTRAPLLIVDTALTNVDADKVRRFVTEGESGQTPSEFFELVNNGESSGEEEALFGGSIVSEVDGGGVDVQRKVLGDKSNTVERIPLKGKVENSCDMKLSNKNHKARTQSARKKRKSAHISPTESRKKRLVDSIRFYVPETKDDYPKHFGLIEGIGGGSEEKGRSNVTPHRGRLLELPGAVLSGQWETRLVKDGTGSKRISLRHEGSSFRSLEHFVTDSGDGHFVSIIKPEISRTHSLINHGVMNEDEFEVDDEGRELISVNAFIGCISIVLFEGFLSTSEAISESCDVASIFLQNCVPSNELQRGRELYEIVANEHNSNDDEYITGMLYPCNVSFDSDHVVLLSHNENLEVCGIDVIFQPTKDWLRQHSLTDEMLHDHLDQMKIGSDDDEIMERYKEKNILKVLTRPSPFRTKAASIVSDGAQVQSEEELEQSSFSHKQSDEESLGYDEFDDNGQTEFVANDDDLSSAGDRNEEVHRLQEESRTLKQRIEHLEEEKRELAQQIAERSLMDKNNGTAERAPEESVAADGLTQDPAPTELPTTTTVTATTKPKKVDIFGENDSLFDDQKNKQSQVESALIETKTKAAEKKATKVLEDLFGDCDSLFGVSTKKINRRKSTGDVSNPRTLLQKHNRGRHSTGNLTKSRESVGKANNSVALVSVARSSSLRSNSTKTRSISTSEVNTRNSSARPALLSNPKNCPPEEKTKKKRSNRRSSLPTESSSRLRFSNDMNAMSEKRKGMTSRKINVVDLFDDDDSMFGCAVKMPSAKKKTTSTSNERRLIPNDDIHSFSSLGGGSAFESTSTQAIFKLPTEAAEDERIPAPTQPIFDLYFGKETEASICSGLSQGTDLAWCSGVEMPPFFDYYFGQDVSGANDDESQYSFQPLYSVYYGFEDQSTVRSITSSFEIPTVPLSLYYFDNEEIVPECDPPTTQPPFFDYYFGQHNDEESSTLLSSETRSQESPVTTSQPPFFDYLYGQESCDDHQDSDPSSKTSWRRGLAVCAQFLVLGILPAAVPAFLIWRRFLCVSNLLSSDQSDVHSWIETIDETTTTWWSLKPWG